jgi:type I restriction-modification system DNA methylase subunit
MTIKNLGGNIKSLRNFMRKDAGVSGDGQRIEQLGWLLFLKILDASDRELELLKDDFVSVVPDRLRWGNWAADKEGMTGDLDVKNPHVVEVERGYSSVELLGMLHDSFKKSDELLDSLKKQLSW